MEHGDGEVAAKSAKLSAGGGEDRLSSLPDDLLIQILLRLGTSTAARTSVLSRRWRLLWCLLPRLEFVPQVDACSIRAALGAHQAPSLLHLIVFSTPDTISEWLPIAARRLSGDLFFFNSREKEADEEAAAREGGAFLELPCLGRATTIWLELGFLVLAMPPSGVFARLTDLTLCDVRFHGPCELGGAISSPRFPSLKKLAIRNAQGLSNLTIHSDSLLEMEFNKLKGLQQLNVVAPALQELHVVFCFAHSPKPVANISAPQLENLVWSDAFDPSSVQFGKMENVQCLGTYPFLVYGLEDSAHNRNCLRLLQRFQFDTIPCLCLGLAYVQDISDLEYMMEDMTVLPDFMFLNLTVLANGHAIGPSLFHILRMCASVRRLKLILRIAGKLEAQAACQSDCVCILPPNWETEELLLNFLHEVEITNLRGTEHEIALVKRLFCWAAVLKAMTIKFHYSVSENTVKELCQMLQSFSRPASTKIYFYHRWRQVLDVTEG